MSRMCARLFRLQNCTNECFLLVIIVVERRNCDTHTIPQLPCLDFKHPLKTVPFDGLLLCVQVQCSTTVHNPKIEFALEITYVGS